MTHTTQDLAISALAFWVAVAEQEAEILRESGSVEESLKNGNKGFIRNNIQALVGMLTSIMVRGSADRDGGADDDDDVDPLVEQVHFTLQCVAAASGQGVILGHILPFAQKNFTSEKVLERDAAVMSLALLQESCCESKDLEGVNTQVLPIFMARLGGGNMPKEESPIIRESIIYYLKEMVSFCPSHISDAATLSSIATLLVGCLGESPKVARMAAMGLNNLFHSFRVLADSQNHFFATSPVSSIFSGRPLHTILTALLQRFLMAISGDSEQLGVAQECVQAFEMVVDDGVSGDAGDLQSLCTFYQGILMELQKPVTGNKAKHENLIFLLHTILMKAVDCQGELLAGIKNSSDLTAQVLFYCLENNLSDALQPLGLSFSDVFHPDLRTKILQPFSAKILACLAQANDTSTVTYALYASSDIVRTLQAATPPDLFRHLLQMVFNVLVSEAADRDLKPIALGLVFDLSLGPAQVFFEPGILQLFLSCIDSAAGQSITEDVRLLFSRITLSPPTHPLRLHLTPPPPPPPPPPTPKTQTRFSSCVIPPSRHTL